MRYKVQATELLLYKYFFMLGSADKKLSINGYISFSLSMFLVNEKGFETLKYFAFWTVKPKPSWHELCEESNVCLFVPFWIKANDRTCLSAALLKGPHK